MPIGVASRQVVDEMSACGTIATLSRSGDAASNGAVQEMGFRAVTAAWRNIGRRLRRLLGADERIEQLVLTFRESLERALRKGK